MILGPTRVCEVKEAGYARVMRLPKRKRSSLTEAQSHSSQARSQ
jgi:hypothetical protein